MSDVSAIPAPELTPPANDDALTPPTFDVLALSPETRACLDKMGYVQPTPVQRAVFEPASRGKDLVVQARTGTGKTTAFGLPIVEHLVRRSQAAVQTLVLCPTRELALQVAAEIERLGEGRQVKTTAIYGGASMTKQIEAINDGAQVVVGTPGRVLDHIKRGTFKPATVRALVLDEADEMLSMGFERELTAIIDALPKDRQTLLFSATLPPDIERMAREKLRQPEFITLSSDAVGALSISHFVYFVLEDKLGALVKVLEVENPESAIIFCNMKVDTEVVTAALRRNGYDADWLNGDLPQNEREEVVSRIRNGSLRFLVATDVAARGIDISHLTHVINYDFPDSTESYVHRTGRTGRAGRTGTAISLVAPQSIGSLYFLRLAYNIRPFERFIPTSSELKTRREADLITHVIGGFASQKARPEDLRLARRLLSHDQAEQVIALLLRERIGTQPEAEDAAGAARRARNPLPPREPPRHVEVDGDRPPRSFDRGDRGGRGGFERGGDRGGRGGDRGGRGGSRGGFDRGDRGDRPSFDRGGERQASERGGERQALDRGAERPALDRDAERPALDRGAERPSAERSERPSFERGERGGRDRGVERAARSAEPTFEAAENASGPESEQVTTPHGSTVPAVSSEAPSESFNAEAARPSRESFNGESRSRGRRDRDSRQGRSDRPARGERESHDEGLPSFTVSDAAPVAEAPVAPAVLPFDPPHHPDLPAEIETAVAPVTASEPASEAPTEARAPRGGYQAREPREPREGGEAPRERRRRGSNRGEGGRPGREQEDMPVRFTVSDAEPVTTERPRPAELSRPVEPSRPAPSDRQTIERPSDLVNWHPAEEEGDDRPIFHGGNNRNAPAAHAAPVPPSNGGGESDEVDDQDFAVVFVDVGRREGVRPSDLQRALRDVAGIGRRDTGRIRVRDRHSLVAVRRDLLTQAIERLTGAEIAGRAVRAEQARERTIEGD